MEANGSTITDANPRSQPGHDDLDRLDGPAAVDGAAAPAAMSGGPASS